MSPMANHQYTELDRKCINTIRLLSADMVQQANSGHPGAPMGLAPAAHVLFTRFLRCSPSQPKWTGRDRFVLSNGHACALQYSMLHLMGYALSMEDLKKFRQLDSKTPGHPENFLTPGVEVTTGPLGQGIGNAVGLAAAEAHLGSKYSKDVFSNHTFVFCGDGCLMEGVAAEAVSLAGHLRLNKLVIIYDDNQISIDGKTDLAFSEDVGKRFEAYGFKVIVVDNGDDDLDAIHEAIKSAVKNESSPTLIKLKTTIGKGAIGAEGTAKVHGAPLGAEKLAATKQAFGFDPTQRFVVPDDVREFYNTVIAEKEKECDSWKLKMAKFQQEYPEKYAELSRAMSGELPASLDTLYPSFPVGQSEATRKDSEHVLNAIAGHLPELVGGSADLTESNLTKWKGAVDFQHPSTKLGDYSGRYFRFGVREHAMFAMCNGLSAYGGLIPFAATFLNFITYGWGAVRLSALSHLRVIYVMTHDSIGLGEDGPTHQPIEVLPLIRALPNCLCLRPADGNEVSAAYKAALEHKSGPSVICLTRQKVPNLQLSSIENALKGAYVVRVVENPELVLVATGSEVAICMEAAGKSARRIQVVSMPSWELFEQQSEPHKLQTFPNGVPVISVEASSTMGWDRYADVCMGLDRFGKSGPYDQVYAALGLSVDGVLSAVEKTINHYQSHPVKSKIRMQL